MIHEFHDAFITVIFYIYSDENTTHCRLAYWEGFA